MAVGQRTLWRQVATCMAVSAALWLSGCGIWASQDEEEEQRQAFNLAVSQQVSANDGWGDCGLSAAAAEKPGTARKGGISDAEVRSVIINVCKNPPDKCKGVKVKITAPLLAAQIYQESKGDKYVSQKTDQRYRNDPDYDPTKVARGIAQFMTGTWKTHGIDGDGDGDKDIDDPADAIASMASYDCEVHEIVKDIPGDKIENMLAAYNAGPGAVQKYKGVPDYRETRFYVDDIGYNAGRFTAVAGPSGNPGNGTKGKPLGYIAAAPWKDGDGQRRKYRGWTLNVRTIRMLEAAERSLGVKNPTSSKGHFQVMQGSYNAGGVGASGGTHDGGGALDLAPVGDREVGALRAAGFAAWARTPEEGDWGPHIHAIAVGDKELSSSAKAQVQNFMDNENGLTNHGRDTYRPKAQARRARRRCLRRRKCPAVGGSSRQREVRGKVGT
ncbi:transglycosylase SLT domain-containing protein [Yinghuangia sp. YIM S09857]|uniref:transglycosylase SLT domain-containing protein n=1 Tax=Yinghuangia sp. YIM S09857 TaxID=3436929 RepID=UPI003F52D8E3